MRCSTCATGSRLLAVHTRLFFFFFNDTATTEIYTLSLHDALPICQGRAWRHPRNRIFCTDPAIDRRRPSSGITGAPDAGRSEEHTSELQSLTNLVCRLLLEKKKKGHVWCIIRMSTTSQITSCGTTR